MIDNSSKLLQIVSVFVVPSVLSLDKHDDVASTRDCSSLFLFGSATREEAAWPMSILS